jgi:hypothetical protein
MGGSDSMCQAVQHPGKCCRGRLWNCWGLDEPPRPNNPGTVHRLGWSGDRVGASVFCIRGASSAPRGMSSATFPSESARAERISRLAGFAGASVDPITS